MSARVFIVLTDAEGGHQVAVNVDAIEVLEAKSDDETWVQTAQHSVVVASPLTGVLSLLEQLANYGELRA